MGFITESNVIPDNLLIEILGNRKDVLFIEGDKGSYDYTLFQYLYPDYFIVPMVVALSDWSNKSF